MINIKLMPDYYCYPIWGMDDDNLGNISPHSLPISNILANELINWAKEYDDTLNINNPIDSGFKNKEDELIFNSKGKTLYNKLKTELGIQYNVYYFSST